MYMTKSERILEMANNNNGYVVAKEVRKANINSTELTRLVKENKLERISRGIYCTPDSFYDDYYKIQSKSKNCIYSHATALYFYDLSDRTPVQLDLTVPVGYNGSLRNMQNVDLHYTKFRKNCIFAVRGFIDRLCCSLHRNEQRIFISYQQL